LIVSDPSFIIFGWRLPNVGYTGSIAM